jgi:hypothetical protein
LAARRGKKRALIAVGHSILKSVYHILKDSCQYKELGGDYLDKKQEKKRKEYLKKELEKLGYQVGLSPKPKESVEKVKEEPSAETTKEKVRKKKK